MALTPTTELQAVNTMLNTIGQSPISSLPSVSGSNALVDAVIAEDVLNEISRAFQSEGWDFNTNTDYAIAPDVDGFLNVPSNTLSITTEEAYQYRKVTLRGSKMWDKTDNTFVFTETLKFKVIFFAAFTDLPEAARRYVTVRAARTFQDRIFGSDTVHVYSKQDEDMARANIERDEHRDAKYSIFDDHSTAMTIHRR